MRIAIVNDLPMVVKILRRAVLLAPENQIAWTASNGAEAVELCAHDRPDVILMDLIMPGMDGVEATRLIMAKSPCAILIVTANVDFNAARVFAAMGHGAIDAVDVPLIGNDDFAVGAQPLLAKLRSLSRLIDLPPVSLQTRTPAKSGSRAKIVAIGASAGGPAALSAILLALPGDFSTPIVVVQHVDERFAASLATWLSGHSPLPVRLAEEGDKPTPGTVLLAGTDDHLVLKAGGRLGYTPHPADEVYRPSVNVFFQSLCRYWLGDAVGVLLTGMGSDGAQGLRAMREKGHHTIAQDRDTSAVYGMPKAAAALGAAVEILPLPFIAPKLTALTGHSVEGRIAG